MTTTYELSDTEKKARKKEYDKNRMAIKRLDPEHRRKLAEKRALPKNKERANRRSKEWREANLDYANARDKEYRRANPHIAKNSKLKKAYGITLEQRDTLLEAQGFVCAVCASGDPGPRDWHVDHCHTSGAVRGILCHHCNTALGLFKDNTATLAAAITYLQH